MPRKLVGLILTFVFVVSAGMTAQRNAGTGRLQVSATVVSSSRLVEQQDGSFLLVVANAPSQSDVRDLQLTINHLDRSLQRDLGRDTIAVLLVRKATAHRSQNHRH